ncbi:hypothetical protein E4T56_gene11824 [Termitomyces sp. T112]|nr:hypothetical protein E4T56_gene11824 [Termitomyces sp. T112]
MEFAYNNCVSTATVDPVNSQMVPKADAQLDRICKVHKELKVLLELAVAWMKWFYDAWVNEAPNYMVGDHVYLKQANLCLDRLNHKLDFKEFGPFQVAQKISDTAYWLALRDGWSIHDVFHISCWVPAHEDMILGQQQDLPPPVQMEWGEEVEIEQILHKRMMRGGVADLLVHWKGYNESEDEWLKEYDMLHALEAIQEFRANEKTCGKGQHKRGAKQT